MSGNDWQAVIKMKAFEFISLSLLLASCIGTPGRDSPSPGPGLVASFTPVAMVVETAVAPTEAVLAPEPTALPEQEAATQQPPLTPLASPPTLSSSTATPTPLASSTPASPTPAALAIVSFTAEVIEDIPGGGKRVRFTWETTGATRVLIWSGATQRNPRNWEVPTAGTMVVDLPATHYANPAMLLTAADDAYDQVDRSVVLQWPCATTYFFSPAPARCPSSEPLAVAAVEQLFEHGRMIWLEQVRFAWGEDYPGLILVLYGNGLLSAYQDTWTADQPTSDPSIMPPAGMYQPVNGFGKLWREHQIVRSNLGWALAPEQSYQSLWQGPMVEMLGDERNYYLQLLEGEAISVYVNLPIRNHDDIVNGWTLIQ